jgi:isoleucyl-tRNA synthetase
VPLHHPLDGPPPPLGEEWALSLRRNPLSTRDWRDTVFLPKTDFPMKAGLPQKEPGILARWQAEGLYAASCAKRARGREKFILHDGPPYANGDMHIGHALNHILKDMVVPHAEPARQGCALCARLGLPRPAHRMEGRGRIPQEEAQQGRGPIQVEFRAECRAYAQHWVDVQREQLKRLGINGDWDNPYLTMDFEAEATIVAELLKFAEAASSIAAPSR